jgi:hypothetical protein
MGVRPDAVMEETFAEGFSAGPNARWFHVHMGSYVTDDGEAVRTAGGGLHVVSPGVNQRTGAPAFTRTLAPERTNGGIPATNDHAKWLAYVNRHTDAGYPGFESTTAAQLVGTARIGGRTFGTELHPFGAAVADPADDVRLAAAGMTSIDLESWMVFDFLFTNTHVYAVYERLPFGRTAARPYAAFTYAIPVRRRQAGQMHLAQIAYDARAGVVWWGLDGGEVFRVSRIGARLPDREHLLIDLGGVEERVAPRQLDFGMGLFTLLDGALPGGSGLVRLSDAHTYYAPDRGEPHVLAFADEESRAESRLFGQGADMHIESYAVHYEPLPG